MQMNFLGYQFIQNDKSFLKTEDLLRLVLLIFMLTSCKSLDQEGEQAPSRSVQDALQREVYIQTSAPQVITMRAGALRLMLYMGLDKQIAYIEKNDLTRQVPYMMAYPELKDLPLIGAGNNYDPEVVATSNADLIISTYINVSEADMLQTKVGKPVLCLSYGDLYHFKEDFYNSLKVIGEVFNKSSRAKELIDYIEGTLTDLQNRIQQSKSPAPVAYIGGIAFNGVQGITSTRAQYPPFIYLNLSHPFDALPHSLESIGMGQKNSLIDKEQLLEWDPDIIFLDVSGRTVWEKEWEDSIFATLKARKTGKVYTLLPFNWHSINYENLLCNMWFIGKTVYPEAFQDVDIQEKYREIFLQFYDRDIYNEVMTIYNPFQRLL
jgi:iron complex transport system substrate-binding protein